MSLRAAAARVLLALVLVAALAQPAWAVIVDRVAAVVNREVITLSQVYEAGGDYIREQVGDAPADSPARRALELEVLDALIQRELISQEMQRLGMDVTPDDVERALDEVARQNGLTREQLRVEVERAGLAWSVYREELEESLRQSNFQRMILMPRLTVTQDDLLDLYNRTYKLNYQGAERRALEGIFLLWGADATPDARAELALRAARIKAASDSGTPWAELVAANPDSALYAAGGRLGSFSPGEAVQEINGPAFALEVGQVSDPIALPNGLLVLRVASAEALPPPSFEQVQDQLYEELMVRRLEQEMELWTLQARRAAAVLVKLEPPVTP